MTALKIIGVILLVFLPIGFLRLSVVVSFGDGLRVRLCAGTLRMTVYPRAAKGDKPKLRKAGEQPKKKEARSRTLSLPKPKLSDLPDLAETAFSALGATGRRACKRVRVDPLELTLVFGGRDPADVAMLYGAANTLMFAVMPRAEETFYIPNPSLHLRPDFDRKSVEADGTLGVSLRLCDLFAIFFTLAVPMARWYLRFRSAHRYDKTAGHLQKPEQQSA